MSIRINIALNSCIREVNALFFNGFDGKTYMIFDNRVCEITKYSKAHCGGLYILYYDKEKFACSLVVEYEAIAKYNHLRNKEIVLPNGLTIIF